MALYFDGKINRSVSPKTRSNLLIIINHLNTSVNNSFHKDKQVSSVGKGIYDKLVFIVSPNETGQGRNISRGFSPLR